MRAVNGQANPLIQQAGCRTATISAGVTLPRLPPQRKGSHRTTRIPLQACGVTFLQDGDALRKCVENDVLRVAHAPNLDAPAAPVKPSQK